MIDHPHVNHFGSRLPVWLACATAYRPLPVEPDMARATAGTPKPKPPSPPPSGSAYPPLPTEHDTREGGGGEHKVTGEHNERSA